jgi:hypothetical protein
LDWDGKTVKELDKPYMRALLRRGGGPTPRVIGLDEVSIRKGHTSCLAENACFLARHEARMR